jgi:FkbM family methyltransferase
VGLLSQLGMHLRSIGAGDRLRDRVAIAALVGLRTLAPLWSLLDRIHVRPPSPLGLIGTYRIRDGATRWEIGGNEGAAYLFPRTVLGRAYGEIEPDLTSGICIDVGASFGWYTVRWAKQLASHGQVIAIEAQPKHYRSLVRNVTLNNLSNVRTLSCAAGEQDGVLDLNIPQFGLSVLDASAVYNEGSPAIRVPMRSIDSICDELGLSGVRLVKIDVEGFEPSVLRGMGRLLERGRPSVLFEAITVEALSACRAEFPSAYKIRRLGDLDYLAEPL